MATSRPPNLGVNCLEFVGKEKKRGPRTAPRPQDCLRIPRLPQDGPKMGQDGPKMAQDGPKMAQDGAEWCQDGAKMARDGAKMAPKDVPRCPQDAKHRSPKL